MKSLWEKMCAGAIGNFAMNSRLAVALKLRRGLGQSKSTSKLIGHGQAVAQVQALPSFHKRALWMRATFFISTTVILSACGVTNKEWEPDKKVPRVYSVAFRQTAPEPVYNRTRWVHLPESLPEASPEEAQQVVPTIFPIIHLEFKNATLEQIARTLAATGQYTSYCSSSLAPQKISINSLGTMEELAQELAAKTGAYVLVDHGNKHLSFMNSLSEARSIEPQFSSIENSQVVSPSFKVLADGGLEHGH